MSKDNVPIKSSGSEWRHVWLAFFGFYILLTETGVRQVKVLIDIYFLDIFSENTAY